MKKLLYFSWASIVILICLYYYPQPKHHLTEYTDYQIPSKFISTKRVYWNNVTENDTTIIQVDSMLRLNWPKLDRQYKDSCVITAWSASIRKKVKNVIMLDVYDFHEFHSIIHLTYFEFQKDKVIKYVTDTTGINYRVECTYYK